MKTAILIFGFLLSLCLMVSEAHAVIPVPGSTLTVNKIELLGLHNYKSHYLTVYYGIGSRASISNAKNQVSIREVKIAETFPINGNALELPKRDLARSGIVLPYNIIVFVIHSGPEFCWKNSNGQFPLEEKQCESNTPIKVDSLMKTELDTLMMLQSDPEIIEYNFGQIVPDSLQSESQVEINERIFNISIGAKVKALLQENQKLNVEDAIEEVLSQED